MRKSKIVQLVAVSLVILAMLMGGGCVTNTAPIISSLTPSAESVERGESCTVSCTATDPDDDILTYDWSATGGTVSGTGNSVTWDAPDTAGTYTVSVTVSDGKDGTDSDSCTIEVVNNPPVISSLTPSAESVAPGGSCTINCTASDPDGDTLTYDWSATGGTITGTAGSASWDAPVAEGTYTISVSVSDGHGGTASDSVDITVEMKFGSIDVQSSPTGAMVYLNGVDTGNITPYVITHVAPGTYDVKLEYYHYKYREETVTVNADETTYINWSLTFATEQTLTIQPAAATGKDAYVYDGTLTTNYPDTPGIPAGARAMGVYRSYLQFSLDSLPDDAVIVSARLALYHWYSVPEHAAAIGVYKVLGSWSETVITWDDQPVVATVPEYTVNVPAAVSDAFIQWYITDLVQSWWSGFQGNFGVMLASTDEDGWEGWKSFWSSDFATANKRPKLIITYFDPTP